MSLNMHKNKKFASKVSVERFIYYFFFLKKVIKAKIHPQGARYLDCPRQWASKSASPSEARYWHVIVVDGVFWISIIQSQSSTLSSIFSTRTSPCSVFIAKNKITLLVQVYDKVELETKQIWESNGHKITGQECST